MTGEDNWASAMSFELDCRTAMILRDSPCDVDTLTVFRVAVVGYGVAPLTRLRFTSWKQWPAVMIHVREIVVALLDAPAAVSACVGRGMSVIVSRTANGSCPGDAIVPWATASAGLTPGRQ